MPVCSMKSTLKWSLFRYKIKIAEEGVMDNLIDMLSAESDSPIEIKGNKYIKF